ncbi:hypothetical protein ALC62_09887 [Cyphomyrmex costatus]|uniref:Uncharacterized protein n=1 Tax=Cyphomyrmex costatus TaxID=456900 RepID=A0A151IEZ6_9HYME|nr:hypothetical protein ALC62_09887 [Cyphomyrmex costatus]
MISGGSKSAPLPFFTLIEDDTERYAPRVTGHGAAMSKPDGVDAERNAQYQSQNGVVATSLRSTLQRSSYVVDPPARQANRRSVPRRSSPMRMRQSDAQ